jgi:AcrR family transcriptional regulator
MGYRHSPDEILGVAVELVLESGMGELTFSGVGQRLGISDRTVVYYFPTKTDLISAVIGSLVADTEQLLQEAFGSTQLTPEDLLRRAWPALATTGNDRVFRLYFEIIGLASARQAPYVDLVTEMIAGWVDWLESRMLGSTEALRRRRAMATLAHVNGLLLVRQMLGPAAADAAARESGVAS